MKETLFVLTLIFVFFGCAAVGKNSLVVEGNNLFVQERDYDVGRSIDVAPLEPSKISSYNQNQNEYLFGREGDSPQLGTGLKKRRYC